MLEQVISKEMYQELMKYNLVNLLEEVLTLKNTLIQIDASDIKHILKEHLCAYYNGCYDANIELKIINRNIKPKRGLLFVNTNEMIPLNEIEILIEKIKSKQDIDLIYGMNVDSRVIPNVLVLLAS